MRLLAGSESRFEMMTIKLRTCTPLLLPIHSSLPPLATQCIFIFNSRPLSSSWFSLFVLIEKSLLWGHEVSLQLLWLSQPLHTCCCQECSSLNLWIQLYQETLFRWSSFRERQLNKSESVSGFSCIQSKQSNWAVADTAVK